MKKLFLLLSLVLVCTVLFCGCKKDETLYDYDLKEYLTLGEFPNVKFDKADLEERMNDSVEEITSEYAETTEVTDRAVKDGDIVNIDYVGKIDGKEFDKGSDKGYDLTIGSDSFIAGFEDGLIDHKIGEEVTLNLVFPEDYGTEELNGKDVVFTVKINSIKAKKLPALTDAMVSEKTSYLTIEEYYEAESEKLAKEILWENYVESCKVNKYPEKETKRYYDNLLNSYSQMAIYNGMTLEQMVTGFYGYKTLDEFLSYAMTTAMGSVKEEMIIFLTVREKNISVTDEEYEKLGAEQAKEYGYASLDEYEDYVSKEGIKLDMYKEKILDKAYEANNISYEAPVIEETEAETTEEKPEETAEETKAETAEETKAETPEETAEETKAETAEETKIETPEETAAETAA